MSEVKFACPVCGQHVTTDSRLCGSQMNCPTCFRALVIPNASSSGETKLVLSAAEAGKVRSTIADAASQPARRPGTGVATRIAPSLMAGLVLVIAAVMGSKWWANRASTRIPPSLDSDTAGGAVLLSTAAHWTLDAKSIRISPGPASGWLNGRNFVSERETLRGSALTLRQGREWPPDLGVSIVLTAPPATGQTMDVRPDTQPPIPRIILRWKERDGTVETQTIRRAYALRLVFNEVTHDEASGSLFLALPTEEQGFVSGSFKAQRVRRPSREPDSPEPIVKQ